MTSSNDEIHQADFNRIINPDEYNAEYDDFNKTSYNANKKCIVTYCLNVLIQNAFR